MIDACICLFVGCLQKKHKKLCKNFHKNQKNCCQYHKEEMVYILVVIQSLSGSKNSF